MWRRHLAPRGIFPELLVSSTVRYYSSHAQRSPQVSLQRFKWWKFSGDSRLSLFTEAERVPALPWDFDSSKRFRAHSSGFSTWLFELFTARLETFCLPPTTFSRNKSHNHVVCPFINLLRGSDLFINLKSAVCHFRAIRRTWDFALERAIQNSIDRVMAFFIQNLANIWRWTEVCLSPILFVELVLLEGRLDKEDRVVSHGKCWLHSPRREVFNLLLLSSSASHPIPQYWIYIVNSEGLRACLSVSLYHPRRDPERLLLQNCSTQKDARTRAITPRHRTTHPDAVLWCSDQNWLPPRVWSKQ